MPETFLILGANSFYGSSFAKWVLAQGDSAVCWSRPQFDIARQGDCWYFENQKAFDYIVNFVSQSLVVESWDDPVQWMYINASMTTNLFENMRHLKIKKFIHVSTPEVYGHTPVWVKEGCAFNPSTPYAVSRAAADMMLMAFHRAYGFPGIITRTANIYGVGQQPYKVIPVAFEKLRADETMALHGGGNTRRSFIHVKDACAATYLIAKKGNAGETYHISTKHAHTVSEVVQKIGTKTTFAPDRLGKDRAYLLNTDKLRALGWEDTITLDQGLKEYAASCSAYA
jgi:dTDP-glucose 4,6-dehydratase